MLKIKKKDEVVVVAGRDKGRRGEVLRVMKDGRLMVAGINMVKKHKRPTLIQVTEVESFLRKHRFKALTLQSGIMKARRQTK